MGLAVSVIEQRGVVRGEFSVGGALYCEGAKQDRRVKTGLHSARVTGREVAAHWAQQRIGIRRLGPHDQVGAACRQLSGELGVQGVLLLAQAGDKLFVDADVGLDDADFDLLGGGAGLIDLVDADDAVAQGQHDQKRRSQRRAQLAAEATL